MKDRMALIAPAALAAVLYSANLKAGPMISQGAHQPTQYLGLELRKIRSTAQVLPKPFKVTIDPSSLEWSYLPESNVSVPFVKLELKNLPKEPIARVNIIVERMGAVKPNADGEYFMKLPLMERQNRYRLTLVNARGQLEEWEIRLALALRKSAVYVDETCKEYRLKLREVRRGKNPNLIYVGCRSGTSPHHLSLDILWAETAKIEYGGKTLRLGQSFVTLPLDHRKKSKAEITSRSRADDLSILVAEYDPVVPPPYEFWAGLAFFYNAFSQSNFPSTFSQISTAFTGRAWYRPEESDFSLMVRGFGTLMPFNNTLDPNTSSSADYVEDELVRTYFVSAEGRYKAYDRGLWRVSPFLGGWMFFMHVRSRKFGLQRIITPFLGVSVERAVTRWDRFDLTWRAVPLQTFIDPFSISTKRLYLEWELAFVHEFRNRGRLFANLQFSWMRYHPEGGVDTEGTYFILGGGYGF